MVFTFSVTPSIFVSHFKVLKHLIPKHIEDSWNLRDVRVFTHVDSGTLEIFISFSENH